MELKRINLSEFSELDYGENSVSFGAMDDGRLKGFIVFSPTANMPDMVSLRHIYVEESYRNCGIGSFMLSESEKVLKALGRRAIISCGFYAYDGTDGAAWTEDDTHDTSSFSSFLEANGFVKNPDKQTLLRYRLSELSDSQFGRKLEEVKKIIGPVQAVDSLSQREKIKFQEQLKQRKINIVFSGLDGELSEVYVKDDDIEGFAFVKRKNSDIYIVDYYVNEELTDKYVFPAMLGRLLIAARNNGQISDITMTVYSERSLTALETILGDGHRIGSRSEYVRFI